MPLSDVKMKTCTRCKRELHESEFLKIRKRGKLVLFPWCGDCKRKYNKLYRQRNKEKLSLLDKKCRQKNRVKNRGIVPDPKIKKKCPNCKKWKGQHLFGKDLGKSSGFDSWCKNCHNKAARARYKIQDRDYHTKRRRYYRHEAAKKRRYKLGSRVDKSAVPDGDPVKDLVGTVYATISDSVLVPEDSPDYKKGERRRYVYYISRNKKLIRFVYEPPSYLYKTYGQKRVNRFISEATGVWNSFVRETYDPKTKTYSGPPKTWVAWQMWAKENFSKRNPPARKHPKDLFKEHSLMSGFDAFVMVFVTLKCCGLKPPDNPPIGHNKVMFGHIIAGLFLPDGTIYNLVFPKIFAPSKSLAELKKDLAHQFLAQPRIRLGAGGSILKEVLLTDEEVKFFAYAVENHPFDYLGVRQKGVCHIVEEVPMYKHDPRRRILKPFKKMTFPEGRILLIMKIPEDRLPFKRVIELKGKPPEVRTRLKTRSGRTKYLKRNAITLATIPIERKDEHWIIYEMNGLREYTQYIMKGFGDEYQKGQTTLPFYDGTWNFQFRIVREDGSISIPSNLEKIMIHKDGSWRMKENW